MQGYTVQARNVTQSGAWETVTTPAPGSSASGIIDATAMTPAGQDGDEIEVRIRAYKGAQNSPWSNTDSVTINA